MRSRVDSRRVPLLTSVLLMAVFCLNVHGADETKRNVRIATFNASLYGKSEGEILRRLSDPNDAQAKKIASIVQSVRPDILLINEIDFDPKEEVARRLAENFFAVSQDGQQPIHFPHRYAAPSNTGMASGLDINRNAKLDEPEDAFGYGRYPGQYAMTVFSRFPIDRTKIRTFQNFRWKDLPGALRPVHPDTGKPYYSDVVWNQLRLSSKNHIDVPISCFGQTIHLLGSHPTPPVFDGVEDHNGCRNHDEIRFWIDYLEPDQADHLVDDRGDRGGLQEDRKFVIMGDLNSDPFSGDSRKAGIRNLLQHRRVQDPKPIRSGMQADDTAAERIHTAAFGRGRTIRVDYVLPSKNLRLQQSGVFWPSDSDERINASDHRLVWIEVEIPE